MSLRSHVLLDDCFLHDKDRLRHADAVTILRERARPIAGHEIVPIALASGRVLAEAAVARHPVPAHTNAAVDGYAFAHADYDASRGASLPVSLRAAAGQALAGPPPPGTAVRIFTGAVVPDGLDTVVMQEDVRLAGEGDRRLVEIPPGLKRGANRRLAGEDVAAGRTLFAPGHTLRPQDVAGLASIGLGTAVCHRRLKVGLVSTGDEIIRPGAELASGQVYDANSPMLEGLVRAAGADPVDLGVWPDDADEVRRRLAEAAATHDVLISSGGASRGEEDHIVRALGEIGRRHLWQLAIKPGRPMSFGQIADTVFVGLPGNPVAVFVCFLMYGFPLLRRLGGGDWPEPARYMLPAAFDFPARKTGRREFWRGILRPGPDGPVVDKYARDGSGLITGLSVSNGLIEIAEEVAAVKPGDRIPFIPYAEFGLSPGAAPASA